MPKLKTVDAVAKLVELLTPFESEERHRIVDAAFTLLGETSNSVTKKKEGENEHPLQQTVNGFSPRFSAWMKQNQISLTQLQQIAHIDGEHVEIIAAIPGKGRPEQILNAYVLQGLGRFIATGSSKFDDKSARAVCEKAGLSDDRKAHSRFMDAKGNKLAGSKEQGWILTDPGLVYAAALVKQIAK